MRLIENPQINKELEYREPALSAKRFLAPEEHRSSTSPSNPFAERRTLSSGPAKPVVHTSVAESGATECQYASGSIGPMRYCIGGSRRKWFRPLLNTMAESILILCGGA